MYGAGAALDKRMASSYMYILKRKATTPWIRLASIAYTMLLLSSLVQREKNRIL